jgi:hypothetical protein
LKDAGLIPDEVTGFFNLPNTSIRTVALGFPTEMSTRNLLGSKRRPEFKADLTIICELIV